VHVTALQRGGIPDLAERQVVRMQVVKGKKGPEASSIRGNLRGRDPARSDQG